MIKLGRAIKRSLQKQPRKEPTKHDMGRAILEPTRKVMKEAIEERAYQFITATKEQTSIIRHRANIQCPKFRDNIEQLKEEVSCPNDQKHPVQEETRVWQYSQQVFHEAKEEATTSV